MHKTPLAGLVGMLTLVGLFAGCATPYTQQTLRPSYRPASTPSTKSGPKAKSRVTDKVPGSGYSAATGRQILAKAREMIDRKEIIQGGCWDYINAIYNRCGYTEAKRWKVYRTKKAGPYANVDTIKPGDWLYFVNHSYGNIEHSSIFVDWVSKSAKIAKMISYAGEKRREPARYSEYNLDSVYGIIRADP